MQEQQYNECEQANNVHNKVILRGVPTNIRKAISITDYEKCVGHIVICESPALLYFPTLSHKPYDFRKKVTENKMCVLIFSTTFVSNVSHSKNN